MQIPERNRVRCEQCAETIDCTASGVAQFVSGWAVNRAKGTNAVAMQERHLRWLCRHCLHDRKRGLVWQQQELPFS